MKSSQEPRHNARASLNSALMETASSEAAGLKPIERELRRLGACLDGARQDRLQHLAGAIDKLAKRQEAILGQGPEATAKAVQTLSPHLRQLADAVRDLAKDEPELHSQIITLADAVQALASDQLPVPRPAQPLPPPGGPHPEPRWWKLAAKKTLRGTLGLARKLWQAAGPDLPTEAELAPLEEAPSTPSFTWILATALGTDSPPASSHQANGDTVPTPPWPGIPGHRRRVLCWDPAAGLCAWNDGSDNATARSPARDLEALRQTLGEATLLAPLEPSALPSSALLETAWLVLSLEGLAFVELTRPGSPGSEPLVLTLASLWHPRDCIDSRALHRMARAQPGRILGKVLHLGPERPYPKLPGSALSLPAGLLGRGPYLAAAGGSPAQRRHRVHLRPPPVGDGQAVNDGSTLPTILLLLSTPLGGGLEQVIANLIQGLAASCRCLLIDLSPPCALSDQRLVQLQQLGARTYPLGRALPELLWPTAIEALAGAHPLHGLLHFGEAKTPGLLADLKHRLPRLPILDHPASGGPGSPAADHVLRYTLLPDRLSLDPLSAAASGKVLNIALPCVVDRRILPPQLSPDRRRALRQELGLAKQDIAVVMLSDWTSEQRPEDFLALAQHLRHHPRFSFFLIGRGPLGSALAELQRFFALPKLSLLSDVGELLGTLAAMDIVCSTAAEHSYPYGLATALALGIPVVAAGREAASLAAADYGLAIETTGDIAAYAEALERLTDEGLRQAYGTQAGAAKDPQKRERPGERPGDPPADPLATYRSLLQLEINEGER